MTVAVSCGEPAGIGPEVAAKAWAALRGAVPFLWIGDPRHLPPGTPWAEAEPEEAREVAATALPVLRLDLAHPTDPGVPDGANAPGVVAAIERAVALTREGRTAAVCTAPISKAALARGGFGFPGHTEFLSHLAGGARAVMMLACDALRVVPVTIHEALADVPRLLTAPLIEETAAIADAALRRHWGLARPRLAVAGLNPHAGEEGRMGREEIEVIAPALDRLRARGLDVRGPLPADTLFHEAARASYDAALCMYHDQALIPIKALDFARGVNVTLGLPFLRTSPDHGTAFGIAGRGVADPTSMIEALRLAHRLGA